VIEKWRVVCNTLRPHSALGYRPPAPAACSPWCHQIQVRSHGRDVNSLIRHVQKLGLVKAIPILRTTTLTGTILKDAGEN
jgi:hypothetical protein